MTCNNDCNQGRCCNCSRYTDRAAVVIVVLFAVMAGAMVYGVWKLLSGAML
jgi:hypothetical protein